MTILIGLVAGAAAALPGPALANPLLSGYGGPGQGNQAILGSALVNGPRGGGGSGGSGDSGSSSSSGESATTPTGGESESTSSAPPPTGKSGSASRGRPGASSGRGSGARRAGGLTRKGASDGKAPVSAGPAGFYPAAERVPVGTQAGALGLSGEDVLLIALAIAALAIVAGFTRRLTRTAALGRQR